MITATGKTKSAQGGKEGFVLASDTIKGGDTSMRNKLKIRLLPAALLLACLPALATAANRPPQLGAITNTCIGQNFDAVTAPALPPGWTTTTTIAAPATLPWATRAVGYTDTGPNAAYLDDANDYADISLVSPTYNVTSTDIAYVTFRHSFVLWTPDGNTGSYNGGVLEVAVNGGAFTDLVTAGGVFYGGGYNAHLDSTAENPIDQPASGRAVWSGDSGGFITTTAILPPAASGGTVQFRWRLGTEGGSRSYDTHSGWWVDSLETQALATISDFIFTDGFESGCR
jgi:hypothetical protein